MGDELQKPDIQAGWIESFLGDGIGKKILIVGGGTLAVAVVG